MIYPTIAVLISMIFVILSYTSFFIDKYGAPARVTVIITNLYNMVTLIVP